MKPMYLTNEQAFLRYIEIPGEGPPLLWLHGWQCSMGELMPAAVQPALRGRRSLLIDFLGHGFSDKPVDFGYCLEDHARTIVAFIDALGLGECGLVGHSMGGGVAVHVAAARPGIVSLLVLAEGSMDGWDEQVLAGQTEEQFLATGFAELVEEQTRGAQEDPVGIFAAHVGMTRILEPRATYREAVSMAHDTDVRVMLSKLEMPRWYLMGELTDPEPEFQRDIAAMGVGWKVVPDTGHPMGLQNPAGFAQAVAAALAESWPG